MKLNDYIRPANHTRLGLHWTPVTGHAHADLTRYIDRAAQMGIGWVMLIDDGGGSTLEPNKFYGGKSIVDMWLERGVVPVIRFFAAPWARFDSRFEDTTRRLVKRGVRYIFWMNEPECAGEWATRGRKIDPNWVQNCTRLFVDGAYKMLKLGAYPGWWATTTFRWTTPDGTRRVNPFLEYMTPQERQDIFVDGGGWIPIHNYTKNHPVTYPYDPVNQFGQPLTHEEYLAKIAEVDEEYRQRTGRLWVWEDWETSEHHINLLRERGKKPGATIDEDDTCFRMYLGMLLLLKDAGLKEYVPLIATEAGPCVGERDDGRYPRITPQAQIAMVEHELAEAKMFPNFFGLCFWLAGVQLLGAATADGFEDQGWWTARHNEPFKLNNELPIVQYLIDRRNRVNTSKLCPHVQYLDGPTLEAIRRVRPPMVKIMNATREQLQSIRAASPGSLIVARMFQENQDYQTDPVAAGRAFANRFADIIGLIDVAEVFNEAINNLADMNACHKFDDYQVAFARRLWELRPEVKVGLFCLPTGNFGYPGEPKLIDFPKTMALPKNKVCICLHEYSWYTWNWESPARCLRYRRLMDGLTGYQVLITECGLTQAVLPGKPDVGWRSGIPRDVFVSGAVWYDNELKRDDYVVGAAMFTCGTSYGWDSFECTAEWEEAVRISAEKQPEFERPIRVLVGGQVRVMELEEYLRAVVPAEMPALWPMETLKAQAVAARSYALWRIQNPRNVDYDIYGDTADQVYDPTFVHERSDQAVRETVGIFLDRCTRYVSKCGQADCPYCQGANGYNGQVWAGRMCQYGAKTMAERGITWREILMHYYGTTPEAPQQPEQIESGGETVANMTLYKDPATNAFQMDERGLVVGCRVDIIPAEQIPTKPTLGAGDRVFRVVKLLFINEEQARGDTRILVQVLDRNGQPTLAKVVNAWPQQRMPRWDGTAYDWASPAHVAEFAQGSGNYDPAKHGPLGPYVVFIEQDLNKQPVASDWCVGFGLPGNRHVAYQVIYQEQVVGEEQQSEQPDEVSGCNLVLAAIARLLAALAGRLS